MTPLRRIAVIGNSLPRRCGIATFSTDLQRAISNSRPNLQTCIVAMTDHDQAYDYPASVALQIKDGSIEEYVGAAAFLNAGRFDIIAAGMFINPKRCAEIAFSEPSYGIGQAMHEDPPVPNTGRSKRRSASSSFSWARRRASERARPGPRPVPRGRARRAAAGRHPRCGPRAAGGGRA